jgi:hypothetical protein
MAVYTTIDDPSAFFQTATYTGGGGSSSVVNDGNSDLQPDLVWFATREGNNKPLQDSTRGGTKNIYSDLSQGADTTPSGVGIASFDSDGFTFGSTAQTYFNLTSKTYVAWQWKAGGGTTVSNSDGSITSTVQANTTAGFSIVTFTGTGSVATVGHGLGVAPDMIIQKNLDSTANWSVKHHKTTNNYDFLNLNLTSAVTANDSIWTQTDPTTSVFSIGTATAINQSGQDQICYCFAEKQGYSKFDKYVGNGNADGTFVYTGFKPAFVMTKPSSSTGSWSLYDHKRLGYNPIDVWLRANGSDAESTSAISGDDIDLYSNGFKLRNSDNTINGSGTTYIYMAFAENPFVTSTGIPTTAR